MALTSSTAAATNKNTLQMREVRLVTKHHWTLLPFMAGVIIGLAFSTVLLIRIPYTESITNVYVNVPGAEETRMSEFEKLMEELHSNTRAAAVLSDELSVKSTVYYAVLLMDSERLEVLNNTWARDIHVNNITFFVHPETDHQEDENEGDQEEERNDLIGISKEENVIELQSSQLRELQVLRYLCDHKVNTSKWFFISYHDLYVQTHKLEAYLQQFEAIQDQVGYLGKPVKRDSIGRVCLPGTGSILSFNTLSAICPVLDNCLEMMKQLDTEIECVLAECLHRQLPHIQCYKEGDPHQMFWKFDSSKKGSLLDTKNQDHLEKALTIFPVPDTKTMYEIHKFVVSKRLNDSQYHLQELKLSLNLMLELLPQLEISHREAESESVITSKDDIVEWKLINNNLLMSDEDNDPALKMPRVWKNELDLLTKKAMDYLYTREEDEYTFKRIVNAYFKVDPFLGISYIIDFEAKVSGAELDEDFNTPSKYFRVSMYRPYNTPEISPVQLSITESKKVVTITVFLTVEEMEAFQMFLKILRKVQGVDEGVELVVVEMKSGKENLKPKKGSQKKTLKSVLSQYKKKYPRASYKVIDSPNLLSRAHGISLIVRELRPNNIVFLADLDLEFDARFIDRCRNIPLLGQQVYFPILFAKLNPSILNDMSHLMFENMVSQHSGYWLYNSTTTACIHAADILAAVQQAGNKGLPNEIDMKVVYSSLVSSGYEVVRAADKGLKRRYSEWRACDLDLHGDKQEQCDSGTQKYEQLYANTQLSILLFDHEGEHTGSKF